MVGFLAAFSPSLAPLIGLYMKEERHFIIGAASHLRLAAFWGAIMGSGADGRTDCTEFSPLCGRGIL